MNNEYNKILDQLMEKISKAVVDEEYDKVVIYNEELCNAVMEMTNSCAEEDKESLYNLISDARDEIDSLKEQIIARQNKLSSDTNKSNKRKEITKINMYKKDNVIDVCTLLKKCNIKEISKYLLEQGKKKDFPDITRRQ